VNADGLGKDYDMLVFVAWSTALSDSVSSVKWNGEDLTYGGTVEGLNGHLDVWFSDHTAQSSGVVSVVFSGTVSNIQVVALLFGDVRRAGGGWLDDWADMANGLSTVASLSTSASYSQYKGSRTVWAMLWETTGTVTADQEMLQYQATVGTGATATQLIVGTSIKEYLTNETYSSTADITTGAQLWEMFGLTCACRQSTRGPLQSGSLIAPTRQLTS
jgi:hypothetical protein